MGQKSQVKYSSPSSTLVHVTHAHYVPTHNALNQILPHSQLTRFRPKCINLLNIKYLYFSMR